MKEFRGCSENRGKAEVLNILFCSVSTNEDTSDICQVCKAQTKQIANYQTLLQSQPKKLNPSKACGPDNIPPSILKQCTSELSIPIAILINKSLQDGALPPNWKVQISHRFLRKENKTSPGNHCPVSLTSVVCQVMVSVLCDYFIEQFKANKLFSDCQYGFMNGRSCSTNLLSVLDLWTMALEEGQSIDTLYLDFAKAFDTVPHGRL